MELICAGDDIFGFDATDAAASMNAAFEPAVSSNKLWAAVLGNHDQESTLSRKGVMKHIVQMKHTLSQWNPPEFEDIDGFGNYNLEVSGAEGYSLHNKSVLNLYFLDSGDYSTVSTIFGYGWIKPSAILVSTHFLEASGTNFVLFERAFPIFMFLIITLFILPLLVLMQKAYIKNPDGQKSVAPGLACILPHPVA